MIGTNIPTVLRHLVAAGEECRQFLNDNLVDLNVRHLELDEIWTFCGKKQRRVRPEEQGNPGLGDQYLFIALDMDSKLICNHAVGKRDMETTRRFLDDLFRRIILPGYGATIMGIGAEQAAFAYPMS